MKPRRRKKLILPAENYLSYTRMELWLKDREKFRRFYYDKERRQLKSPSVSFGSKFAHILEEEREAEVEDVELYNVLAELPKYDVRDKEIIAKVNGKSVNFFLLGKPDTKDSFSGNFREYKTGVGPWSQLKADKNMQIKFYQALIYLNSGKIPTEAHLDWIPTKLDRIIHQQSNGYILTGVRITPTGAIKSYLVKLNEKTLFTTLATIMRVAEEIAIDYANYQKNSLEIE